MQLLLDEKKIEPEADGRKNPQLINDFLPEDEQFAGEDRLYYARLWVMEPEGALFNAQLEGAPDAPSPCGVAMSSAVPQTGVWKTLPASRTPLLA